MLTNLQAFRFIFALFVFASHLNYIIPTNTIFWNRMYRYLFREGYIGVTFFFMLSGYILAYRYASAIKNSSFSFKTFLNRRMARLLPIYYVSLLLALPLTFNEFINGDRVFYLKKLFVNLLLLQSYIPIDDYYFSFNGVSWSISTELFFYLSFPFLLLFIIKYEKLIKILIVLVLGIIALCILFFFVENAYYWLYISPFTRVADFLVGIISYFLTLKYRAFSFISNDSKREYLAVMIAILFLTASPHVHQNFKLSVFYWCPMIIILLVFSQSKGQLTKFLARPIFQYLGSLSFSFYLTHHTFFKYYQKFKSTYHFELQTGVVILILLIISMLCSHLLYKYVEKPARNYLRR